MDVHEVKISQKDQRLQARDAVDETSAFEEDEAAFPNMLFVPQKMAEPIVEAREFALYVALLFVFYFNITTQHYEGDQRVVTALQNVCNMKCFNKMDTFDDYLVCWDSLSTQLHGWSDAAIDSIDKNGPLGIGMAAQKEAVLVGIPFITQHRGPISAPFNVSETSTLEACPWPLEDELGSDGLPTGVKACYASRSSELPTGQQNQMCPGMLMGAAGAIGGSMGIGDVADAASCLKEVYYLPNVKGVLNGTYQWSPRDWYDRGETQELGHSFMIYLPQNKRLATANIIVHFDETGQASLKNADGSGKPEFFTYEPFQPDTDPWDFGREMLFYVVMAYYLLCELTEVWDCTCMSELIVPFKVLTDSMELALLEIQYFHARTSEVYDPRDPATGAAFTFPDVQDLEQHVTDHIQPKKQRLHELCKELKKLKQTIMQQTVKTITDSLMEDYMLEMERLQTELMIADSDLQQEIFVADSAAVLQLAVMWWNKWSMDFPPKALAHIANDPSIPEDGKEAFCKVDWIQVSRDYLAWVEAGDLEGVEGKAESQSTEFRVHKLSNTGGSPSAAAAVMNAPKQAVSLAVPKFLSDKGNKEPRSNQEKRFAQLAQFIDYLQMLRDVLQLHSTLVETRAIRYWNGPRTEDISNTMARTYQGLIGKYNSVGKELMDQMRAFPDEIQQGFHEPNLTKAATIKVRAQSIQRDLKAAVSTCGALGFYFPGSSMWEVQRRLREAGQYEKTESFFLSLKPGSAGSIVDANSMQMYIKADLTGAEQAAPSVGGAKSGKAKSGGKKKGKKEQKQYSNPLLDAAAPIQPEPEPEPDEVLSDDDSGQLSPRKLKDRREIFTGMTGWREWVPLSARSLVTFDGQFIVDPDESPLWKCVQGSVLYPMLLWVWQGLLTYLADMWNLLELISYCFFMMNFYCKIRMYLLADELQADFIKVQSEEQNVVDMEQFSQLSNLYQLFLIPNGLIMWIKLFKYVDVIPQMGMLIQVIGKAFMPVLIFTTVGIIPIIGLAFCYNTAYGQSLPNYRTIKMSLNTLLRFTVGDFDFDELMDNDQTGMAIPLFWTTTVLLVFGALQDLPKV